VQRERAMEMLAVKWGCMSDDEKAPYYQKAVEVKEAYRTRVCSLRTVPSRGANSRHCKH